ncbi:MULTISPECIES: endospore germination permease [unclassified Paenibacillus]|uniref:GerAB/ArcD/ProY family transporter n=1 Tax=unclassified Paenibacillus TaxID=185978 RepID=UPI001AE657B5|nr:MULTISPECIES: endospore germination permease [unclassified Paenibacillus]MBP1155814.1 spore germination protein KB [Paenibacillus sp. PvP091]MBP1168800.1 spore germination protein KB [Paenibacillus sp. PvR098]MBP2439828.1 spore germination protein KB [Paenibacillus sp. PvP052]
MKENRAIGVHQFTVLVIFFGMGTSILIAPSPLAAVAKQDAWISSILGILLGLLPIAVYVALSSRFPHKTLMEMNELVFGKWLGKAVSFLYILFFLILSSLLLGDIGYFLTTDVMPETPIVFIMACLMVVVIMGTRLGPEVMARGAEIFFPWVVLLLVLLILMLLPKMDAVKIQPVLENGWMPVIKAVFPFFSLQEYVILMMIYPFVKVSKKAGHAFYSGSLIAGAVIIIIVLLCILVLGPDLTTVHNYPSFILAKKISVGKFFERVEIIIGGIWFITITFKLILSFFAAALGASQVFRLKSYSFLTIPLGMFTIVTNLLIYTNIVYVNDFIQRVWPAYASTFMLVLPLVTWIVAKLRKKSCQNEPS